MMPRFFCYKVSLGVDIKSFLIKSWTTGHLYPGRNIFELDQGHVTKNQPITMPVLLSESLGIKQLFTEEEVNSVCYLSTREVER